MPRYEINALTLIAIFIAASVPIAPEHPMFGQPLVGLALLIVLFAYDGEGHRNSGQSLGFAAVAGYCGARALFPLLIFAAPMLSGLGALPWFSILWVVATLIFWTIDIARMGKRAVALQTYPAAPTVPQAAPVFTPPTVREEPVRAQAPVTPTPAPVRATSATSLFSQPLPAPKRAAEDIPTAPTLVAPPAQAVAIPQGSGKPATIYLNLVGEGLPCLRTVQAEHLGKDFYLIVEPVPLGEAWEFQPGQVVRCQKRNLSNGKALVAVEEAPRAS